MIERKLYFLCILVLCTSFSSCSSGVNVSISNHTDEIIEELKVLYTGGSNLKKELKPHMTVEFTVNPTSESHLEIEFKDSKNRRYKSTIGTYFEKDYVGVLLIRIESFKKITWEDNIRVSRFIGSRNRGAARIGTSRIIMIVDPDTEKGANK